ncbi:hypothetical protein [Pricia sp.]
MNKISILDYESAVVEAAVSPQYVLSAPTRFYWPMVSLKSLFNN